MNRELFVARPPCRIVSLVPSDTDTLFALGAGDRVVGRTRYCVEPAGRVEDIAVCGGTKDIDVQKVLALAPDLVVCNQEENARAPLEELARAGVLVYVSLPVRVAQGIAHMARLARMLELGGDAGVRALFVRANRVLALAEREARERARPVPVFMPIWMDPLMTVSGDTFGSDMLRLAGARNVFGDRQRLYPLAADLGKADPWSADKTQGRDTRYPRITLDEVAARAPRAVLLPDEPHGFTDSEAEAFRQLPGTLAVRAIDGKDVFWYGARSIDGLERLRAMVAALAL